MIRLHYSPPMCSLASMTALELAGTPYDPVLQAMSGDRADLGAVSPLVKIPVLQPGDVVITETIAILCWIARLVPEARLMATDPDEVITAMSRMSWFSSHLYIVRRRYFTPALCGAQKAPLSRCGRWPGRFTGKGSSRWKTGLRGTFLAAPLSRFMLCSSIIGERWIACRWRASGATPLWRSA